mgnify:CR=1 FL=1
MGTVTDSDYSGCKCGGRDKAVKEYAQQFESRVKNGFAMDGRKITLKDFSDRWMEEYATI